MAWNLISNLAGGPGPVGPAGPDWFKGTLTTGSNLDALANGLWLVPSSTVAVALGLPGGSAGYFESIKDASGIGLQTSRPLGAVAISNVRRRTSSGWQAWSFEAIRPIRLVAATHGNFTWDALPDGWYFNDQATLQSLWSLPVQVCEIRKGTHPVGYGLAELREWAPPYRTWINRRTTNGWQGWELETSGGGGMEIGVLIAQQNMDVLPDGWWEAPNDGVAQSLGFPGGLKGFLLQSGTNRQYTNRNGVFVSDKPGASWGIWNQAGVEDGYTPLQPPTGLPWMQEDAAGSSVMFLDQDHHGSGYAINTQNWPGANSGWVLHQYSNESAGMIIDNCRSMPAVRVNNTQNSSITPGYIGDGDFFQLGPWDDVNNYNRWLTLGNDLVWRNDTKRRMGFQQVYDTGDILQFFNQAGTMVAAIAHDGSYVTTSPNGTLWKILVSDTGVLSTAAA
ncbi:pyocin knob domain-containing protein [Paeniglutamicibacter sp.]|uniref:pyocin knob domain-containing protein n=1 Tax=Paeniglutamicibacter sp. TaxID=1934391 RepID=UPI0039891287